ncbi:hypothetical protein BDE02_14G004800 [Populus trichocarpa]|nr:hypothetical protein BDE02_14G004800 [Populus trichocarpa]
MLWIPGPFFWLVVRNFWSCVSNFGAWAYAIWFLLVRPSIQFCFVSSSSSFYEVGDFIGCLIFFYEIVTLCMFLGLILMTLSGGCLAGKKFFFMYCFLCSWVD